MLIILLLKTKIDLYMLIGYGKKFNYKYKCNTIDDLLFLINYYFLIYNLSITNVNIKTNYNSFIFRNI